MRMGANRNFQSSTENYLETSPNLTALDKNEEFVRVGELEVNRL